jgi:RNA-directed DNA polymerase
MIISSAISPLPPITLEQVCAWDNLLLAWHKASRGKRNAPTTAAFEHHLADRLLALREELMADLYCPGAYTHFYIHEPKHRRISAAPFRDRVVHHALCNVLEPHFERRFLPHSFANRPGKGTHRAVDQVQRLAKRHRFALRMDIVQHFASIDHAILSRGLQQVVKDERARDLVRAILSSGDGVLEQEYRMVWFPGDDLLAACRSRGLPIGNLTSQFWSNCYLHPFDLFVTRELGCQAYVRYVDDMVLFADNKATLWEYKRRCIDRLARLRLSIHAGEAQAQPVSAGISWLGFLVFPTHRRVKGRKVRHAGRRLTSQFDAWKAGAISFAEFDASVKGWINHVRYADSWGLRRKILEPFVWTWRGPR